MVRTRGCEREGAEKSALSFIAREVIPFKPISSETPSAGSQLLLFKPEGQASDQSI